MSPWGVGGAVGVDVLHVVWAQPRVAERVLHGTHRTAAVVRRARDVVCVAAHAESGDLAVRCWRRAPGRRSVFLKHQHGCAVTEHKAVPVSVPRAAGAFPDRRCGWRRARMEAKPATVTGEVACSEPPTTITSASPYWIRRAPRPMLCVPVVQAVTRARLGPRKPYLMDRLPAIMLMTLEGTKNGETREAPLLR